MPVDFLNAQALAFKTLLRSLKIPLVNLAAVEVKPHAISRDATASTPKMCIKYFLPPPDNSSDRSSRIEQRASV